MRWNFYRKGKKNNRVVIVAQTITGFCCFFEYNTYPSYAHLDPLVDVWIHQFITWDSSYLKWFYMFSLSSMVCSSTCMVSHACYLLLFWFFVTPKPSFVWICISVVDYEWVVHSCGLSNAKSLSHLFLVLYMYFPLSWTVSFISTSQRLKAGLYFSDMSLCQLQNPSICIGCLQGLLV